MTIIDSHTHVFPKNIRENRFNFFDSEPGFKLLYRHPKSRMIGADQLIHIMDKQGVDISIICGFPWQNPKLARYHNNYIIESVQRCHPRLKGLACFNVYWEGAAKEAERCIEEGLSGVGELAFYLTGIDKKALECLAPVMAILKQKDAPCLIHTNEPIGHEYTGKTPVSLNQIYSLASSFPENKIILAHWGGGVFLYHSMKRQTKKVLKNIWYDTAASVLLYDPAIYNIALAAGVIDKILFGSDYPLAEPERYYKDMNASCLSFEHKQQILGSNAIRLYQANACSQ